MVGVKLGGRSDASAFLNNESVNNLARFLCFVAVLECDVIILTILDFFYLTQLSKHVSHVEVISYTFLCFLRVYCYNEQ